MHPFALAPLLPLSISLVFLNAKSRLFPLRMRAAISQSTFHAHTLASSHSRGEWPEAVEKSAMRSLLAYNKTEHNFPACLDGPSAAEPRSLLLRLEHMLGDGVEPVLVAHVHGETKVRWLSWLSNR